MMVRVVGCRRKRGTLVANMLELRRQGGGDRGRRVAECSLLVLVAVARVAGEVRLAESVAAPIAARLLLTIVIPRRNAWAVVERILIVHAEDKWDRRLANLVVTPVGGLAAARASCIREVGGGRRPAARRCRQGDVRQGATPTITGAGSGGGRPPHSSPR